MSCALPINLQKRDNSPAAIAEAADYAVAVASGFESWMRHHGPPDRRNLQRPFAGLRVLEIGPGHTLGSAVLLACAGARVAASDRFLAPWDTGFHSPFYRAIREKIDEQKIFDPDPIDRLLEAQGFVSDVISCHASPAEELWKIGTAFDVVISNAVLEHVQDIDATAANLAAITAPGGYGFHQVDLRDHRDFTRPLEYLTISSSEYTSIRERAFCEGGCQWRASTLSEVFERAGFTQVVYPNMFADPAYLADVRPRLHEEFRAITEADLAAISALYVLSRK